ncbi:hypothetical protein BRC19_03300 [Candidatus Saccharibacteria bacterium QS_5_54_17]|nr:MAG: hypothetical protein BRC19_03300 [Candidatus Saccharibacteria bacterium QS_5_54_17]
MYDEHIEKIFPALRGCYKVTSPQDDRYNCIAWAAGSTNRWWWPSQFSYWPEEAALECTIEAFEEVYRLLDYEVCEDSSLEDGYEKIAIYADSHGIPTHAAKQLQNGKWSSKLGGFEDIEHESLWSLEGNNYGKVVLFMKKPYETS